MDLTNYVEVRGNEKIMRLLPDVYELHWLRFVISGICVEAEDLGNGCAVRKHCTLDGVQQLFVQKVQS